MDAWRRTLCCLWIHNDWAYPYVSIGDVKLGEILSVNFAGLQLFLIWGRNSKELSASAICPFREHVTLYSYRHSLCAKKMATSLTPLVVIL